MTQDSDSQLIKKLYEDGNSIRDVAEITGFSAGTVRRRLQSLRAARRHKNQGAKDKNSWWQKKEYLFEKYIDEKLSTTEIAQLVDASSRTVHTWLVKFNIPTRPTGGAYKIGTKMSKESRRKMSVAKKGKYTGAENPNWKGAEITDEVRERRSYKAKVWRQECLTRDKFTCTVCESKKNLHVHHILPFATHPDRRWDINNGQTVCANCHEKIHNRSFPYYITKRKMEQVEACTPKFVKKKKKLVRKFEIEKEALEKLYKQHAIHTIAEMFGFGTKAVRSKLIEYKIQIGGPGGRKKVEMPSKSEIKKVYPKYTVEKAAPKFGIGSTVFLKWLNYYNIPTTKKNRQNFRKI